MITSAFEDKELNNSSLPEKDNIHYLFAKEWIELGCHQLEYKEPCATNWTLTTGGPYWYEDYEYRFANDRHFLLRRKWIDSGKTLPIECLNVNSGKWFLIDTNITDVYWNQIDDYR